MSEEKEFKAELYANCMNVFFAKKVSFVVTQLRVLHVDNIFKATVIIFFLFSFLCTLAGTCWLTAFGSLREAECTLKRWDKKKIIFCQKASSPLNQRGVSKIQQWNSVFLRLPCVVSSNNQKQSWLQVMETERWRAKAKHLRLHCPHQADDNDWSRHVPFRAPFVRE